MSVLREDVLTWRRELLSFVDARRGPIPARDVLSPRQDWQRRITGGVLKQFFELLEHSTPDELFPDLQSSPLQERLFLFITDHAGFHAGRELMNHDSEQALILLREEWRAFLERGPDPDEGFDLHYEFWSVWHQEIPHGWDLPDLPTTDEIWVHEEGFALADGAGRGAQHLWRFDGTTMHLESEAMTSWASLRREDS
jgi:hypothetical protein